MLVFASNYVFADERYSKQLLSPQQDTIYLKNKMKQCMSFVNVDVLQGFESKGLKLNREIKLLCNNNNRNKAQNRAIEFSIEIQSSKDISTYKSCQKILKQAEPKMQKILQTYFISNLRFTHICD